MEKHKMCAITGLEKAREGAKGRKRRQWVGKGVSMLSEAR